MENTEVQDSMTEFNLVVQEDLELDDATEEHEMFHIVSDDEIEYFPEAVLTWSDISVRVMKIDNGTVVLELRQTREDLELHLEIVERDDTTGVLHIQGRENGQNTLKLAVNA